MYKRQALGHPDTVMARNMDVAPGLVFFVVYDMATSTVRKITSNNTDGMMMAYMRHASMFHAADIRNDWDRYVTPALVGLHPPNQQERVITRQWGYPVVSHLLSFACHGPSNGNLCAILSCYMQAIILLMQQGLS